VPKTAAWNCCLSNSQPAKAAMHASPSLQEGWPQSYVLAGQTFQPRAQNSANNSKAMTAGRLYCAGTHRP
jgi:hypothetical protein